MVLCLENPTIESRKDYDDTKRLSAGHSLGNGEEGIIHAISGDKALISRLAGMGIVLNTRIRFLRANGGLVIVQVAETRVALGASEAAKILVRPLPVKRRVCTRRAHHSSSRSPASPTRENRRCSTS